MSETDIGRAIRKALESLGYVVTRVHSGKVKVRGGWMQLADEGTPDHHVMCPNGASIWLETKTEEGDLSEAQKAWHARARRMGHAVAVVRSPKEAWGAVKSILCDHDGAPAADCARCAPDPLARKRPASMGMIALSEFDDL